jgi:Phage portal protein, SPP1 Gp6-like
MFDTIISRIPGDRGLPPRARTLGILHRVLEGTLYDALPYEFHQERTAGGDYIPLRERRPSVRYGLCRIIVEDSVALLFSEGHFPTIDSPDRTVAALLADIVKECRLNQRMTEAAIRGSVGSVALSLRILKSRIFVDVLDTTYLLPEWDEGEPDKLVRVVERYKASSEDLLARGYELLDPDADYWFQRVWTDSEEAWFVPTPVGTPLPSEIDADHTTQHNLGFVPIVWIKNLPGPSATSSAFDGACTFRPAVETAIEIDYQLSQAGRGLKYSSDPTLIIKEPALAGDGTIARGGGNALVVSEKGDAKLLEIGGTAASAVIEYVRTLREFALESVHGSRANADRLTAAQSGRAIELLNQGLIWLADNLRVSYGEGALLDLMRMILRAAQRYPIRVFGRDIERPDPEVRLTLKWPRWYTPTAEDRLRDAQTLSTLSASGQISRESAVKAIADTYDIEDVLAELARIAVERRADTERPSSRKT